MGRRGKRKSCHNHVKIGGKGWRWCDVVFGKVFDVNKYPDRSYKKSEKKKTSAPTQTP